MLIAKYKGQYRRNDALGKRFVYSVTGTPEEMEAYKKAQGANFKADEDGTVLFFVTEWMIVPGQAPRRQIISKQLKLQVSMKGDKVFVDDSDKTLALNEKIENGLADAIIQRLADQYVNGNAGAATKPTAKKEPKIVEETAEDIINQLKAGVETGAPVINEPPVEGTVATL